MRRNVSQVMVITSEGLYQAYNIDMETGGECTLMKEFTWVLRCLFAYGG